MKARIIRDDIEISPSAQLTDAEIAQICERKVWRNGAMRSATFWQLGAMVDRPDSHLLVEMGVAEPIDEECEAAAGMTQSQMLEAQHASRRLAAGIHPEDFHLYDAGIITGYNPDGTYKPGPNFDQLPDNTEDEDEE